jgi:hypothetical protein
MKYVFSTMTDSVRYCTYSRPSGDLPVRERIILIKGGSNVAHLNKDGGIYTPHGVVTTITDEEYEILKDHPVFLIHLKHRAVKIENANISVEKAASDLIPADKAAPRTPEYYAKNEPNVKPLLNTKSKKDKR